LKCYRWEGCSGALLHCVISSHPLTCLPSSLRHRFCDNMLRRWWRLCSYCGHCDGCCGCRLRKPGAKAPRFALCLSCWCFAVCRTLLLQERRLRLWGRLLLPITVGRFERCCSGRLLGDGTWKSGNIVLSIFAVLQHCRQHVQALHYVHGGCLRLICGGTELNLLEVPAPSHVDVLTSGRQRS